MAKKILLVEDSVTMQKVFEMTFGAEDVTVTAVSRGTDAIVRAKEMRPDLVIADLSMPGKNGYDVCAELKADPQLASTPVLLLHGSASLYDESRAKSVQADGEIAKPFETQTVIDKAKAMMAAKPVVKEARPPLGPVESLAPPIESRAPEIMIETDEPEPAVPAEAAAPRPAPAPAVPKPATVVPRPAAPAPRPATPALVVKPAVAAPKPAAPVAAPKPAAPARPLTGAPAAVKPAAPAITLPPPRPVAPPKPAEPQEVEIVIEAEPPPREVEPLPSFDFQAPASVEGARATMPGMGGRELPPPPAGMPLPPNMVPHAAARGEPVDQAAYEAIAKLSRETIERIVWEVVPDLAEKLIRQEVGRLAEKIVREELERVMESRRQR